ncbi:hypothetical protein BC833DRAFT_411444 [Globomyces pollinis-pini]|nr:hypothetical protein BC833DRAFT_411444 [Globomyces pollinis-pini]
MTMKPKRIEKFSGPNTNKRRGNNREPNNRREPPARDRNAPANRGGKRERDASPDRVRDRDSFDRRGRESDSVRRREYSPRISSAHDNDRRTSSPPIKDVPSAHIVVIGDVGRFFISRVEQICQSSKLTFDTTFLQNQNLEALVNRLKGDGTIGIIFVEKSRERSGNVALQILYKTGKPSGMCTNRSDSLEYDNLSPEDACLHITRERDSRNTSATSNSNLNLASMITALVAQCQAQHTPIDPNVLLQLVALCTNSPTIPLPAASTVNPGILNSTPNPPHIPQHNQGSIYPPPLPNQNVYGQTTPNQYQQPYYPPSSYPPAPSSAYSHGSSGTYPPPASSAYPPPASSAYPPSSYPPPAQSSAYPPPNQSINRQSNSYPPSYEAHGSNPSLLLNQFNANNKMMENMRHTKPR